MSFRVTLHVRVWIEMSGSPDMLMMTFVTLHVRVWIEILGLESHRFKNQGHPPREGVD